MPDRSLTCSRAGVPPGPPNPPGFIDLKKNGFTLPGGEQVWGCAICRWPSPGRPGWFRHKPRARTVLSPSGVCHSLLLLSAMPVTGFGSAVPPATGFVRLRHSRLSGNAHKTLTSQEGIMANQKPVAEVRI